MAERTLVVCYSRSGFTRIVGQHIAAELGADFECIRDVEPRTGVLGFARSTFEALAKGVPVIGTQYDPGHYDRVVLGTPVWAGTMAAPVRAYLLAHGHTLRAAGFFAVMGGMGGEQAIREMKLGAAAPDAPSLTLRERDIERERHLGRCTTFVNDIRHLERARPKAAGALA